MTTVPERGLVKLAPRLLNKLPARALSSDHLSTIFLRTLDIPSNIIHTFLYRLSITESDPETNVYRKLPICFKLAFFQIK